MKREARDLALYACAPRGRRATDVMHSIAVLVPHSVWLRQSRVILEKSRFC